VTDDDSVQRAVGEAGHVDVLVNNATEIAFAPIESFPFEEIRHLYEINLFGALRMIQALVPAMRERRAGTVVNVSSAAVRVSRPLNGMYSSTKWALEAVSESLRVELGHFGVRVVLVEPGTIGTGALDAPRAYYRRDDPYLPLAAARALPPREAMTPTETIARVVADAVESPERQFRWPAGADAEKLLAARARLDDAAFDIALRSTLGIPGSCRSICQPRHDDPRVGALPGRSSRRDA